MPACDEKKQAEETEPPRLAADDDERDIETFQAYIYNKTPEELWDILSHVDEDLYPRRREAVHKEMTRRGLFFVPPYTVGELRLRAYVTTCLVVALLTLLCRSLIDAHAYFADLARSLGTTAFELAPGNKQTPLADMAIGLPQTARQVFPFFRTVTVIGGITVTLSALVTLFLLFRHRIRRDITILTVAAALFLGAVCWYILR